MLKFRHACYYVGIPAIVQESRFLFYTQMCIWIFFKKNLKATCNFREKGSIQKNILEKKLKGNRKLEKKNFLACLVLEVARESEINLEGSGNGAR